MPDIRLIQTAGAYQVGLDWGIFEGTLDERQALASAVLVALTTDATALPEDTLPYPDETDRKGWWADQDADELWGAWPVGSRLWLLRRSKITDAGSAQGPLLAVIDGYIRECLQPFIDKGIASRMGVSVVRSTTNNNRVDCAVALYRGPSQIVDLRFALVWDELQA